MLMVRSRVTLLQSRVSQGLAGPCSTPRSSASSPEQVLSWKGPCVVAAPSVQPTPLGPSPPPVGHSSQPCPCLGLQGDSSLPVSLSSRSFSHFLTPSPAHCISATFLSGGEFPRGFHLLKVEFEFHLNNGFPLSPKCLM